MTHSNPVTVHESLVEPMITRSNLAKPSLTHGKPVLVHESLVEPIETHFNPV